MVISVGKHRNSDKLEGVKEVTEDLEPVFVVDIHITVTT